MTDTIQPTPISRRRFIKQSTIALGAVAGAQTLLAACGGSSTSSTTNPTKLTVMYNKGEFTPAYIKEFEKLNPTIKITYLEYDQTRLSAMLAAGAPPDFVRTQGAPEMPNLIARGLVLDITPYLQNSKVIDIHNLQPVNDVYRWNGSVQGQGNYYGLAKDWSQDAMMWYNKKLFDDAKVPYLSETEPVTYTELLNIAKKLTVRANGKIKVYGLDAEWGFIQQGHIIQMLAQEEKSLFNSDFSAADFTTPEVQKIFQWYVDWAQAHVGPSPLDPDPDGWSGPPFQANRLAIAMYGYWFGGVVSSDTNGLGDHVGFAPAPLWGQRRLSACMSGTGAWIPKKSKHPYAAWKVMEYFMAGTPGHDRAKSGWGIPSLKSLQSEMPQDKPYQAQALQEVQHELPYLEVLHFSPYASYNAVEAAITKNIEPVMRGQSTLAKACQQLTDEVNNLLKQGKEQVG